MDLGFSNKSILVTGGSSGIGLEITRLLVDEGALVTICGRDLSRLRATEADLDSPNLHTPQADVYDPVQGRRPQQRTFFHLTANGPDHWRHVAVNEGAPSRMVDYIVR
mgnify:CR=1 FL=1